MEMFWEDTEEARASSCLSTALWRLRVAIEPEGVVKGSYLLTDRQDHDVRFNPDSDYWLDAAEFEDQAKQIGHKDYDITPENLEAIEGCLAHYNFGILNGLYDDWALREHERFRDMYIQMLNYVVGHYIEKQDFSKSLHYGRVLLDLDPLREDVHRMLISLFMENGQRSLAIRQYHQCKMALKNELQISPDEKTQALFDKIVALHPQKEVRGWAGKEESFEVNDRHEMVELIKQTYKKIDDLQNQLQLMIMRMDHYMKSSE